MQKFFSCVILFVLAVSLCSVSVFAQEEGLEYLLFEEIPLIEGISKKAESLNEAPMSVYVVTNEELNRWGVRGLYELFQRVPGYSFYNTDFYGQYGAIGRGLQSIWRYGFSFELMNVVDFGHWEFTPHFFKNIEIARGPAGLMWGSGAEAGLLNFNIRDDLEGMEVVTEVGNLNRRAYDIMYGKKINDDGDNIFIGWHNEEQDPKVQTDAFDVVGQKWKTNGINPSQSLLAKVVYKPFKFIIYQDHADHVAPILWFGDEGLQNAIETFQPDAHDQLEVLAYRAEYHIPLDNEDYSLYVYHDYYKKQWWTESVALDTQRKRSLGINGEAVFLEDKLNVNYGGDFWGEDQITAPSHTTQWARPWGINWYDSNLSPTKTAYRNFFVQGLYQINDQFKVLLGGRTDYEEGAEKEIINSGPRIGLMYFPTDKLTVKYLYNNAKRRPQGNEAGQGASAEELTAHELVSIYEITNKLKIDVTLYIQELQDQITRQNVTDSLNAFTNLGGLESKGIEWAIKYLPVTNLLVYWNGSYQKAYVLKGSISGVEVSDPYLADGSPLFVPELTSFLGSEIVFNYCSVNLALRTINNIPYLTASDSEGKISVNFVDLTIRSKKFLDDKWQVSLICTNLLDNDKRVPAYGEHSGNTTGTLKPEGLRMDIRVTANF